MRPDSFVRHFRTGPSAGFQSGTTKDELARRASSRDLHSHEVNGSARHMHDRQCAVVPGGG